MLTSMSFSGSSQSAFGNSTFFATCIKAEKIRRRSAFVTASLTASYQPVRDQGLPNSTESTSRAPRCKGQNRACAFQPPTSRSAAVCSLERLLTDVAPELLDTESSRAVSTARLDQAQDSPHLVLFDALLHPSIIIALHSLFKCRHNFDLVGGRQHQHAAHQFFAHIIL